MSSRTKLEAATQDRKARLAQLKSLKRKQPEPSEDNDESFGMSQDKENTEEVDVTRTYLSGRNYDPETRGPKLGFEATPIEGKETIETRATELAERTRKVVEEEEKTDAPLDLFKLQPKKPNWDLKRELKEKMQVLDVRTDNAIARLVRERLEAQKKAQGSNGEAAGLQGADVLRQVHAREREEEEEERREKQMEEEMMSADVLE
jgi:coiled-coil domain-containing protein 12